VRGARFSGGGSDQPKFAMPVEWMRRPGTTMVTMPGSKTMARRCFRVLINSEKSE
jgi:hypothetical protein